MPESDLEKNNVKSLQNSPLDSFLFHCVGTMIFVYLINLAHGGKTENRRTRRENMFKT